MKITYATALHGLAIIAALTAAGRSADAKERDNRMSLGIEGAVVRDHRGEPQLPKRLTGYGHEGPGERIIRDHRANPQPWSLPPRWHPHNR